jgi:hypothetical protein
MLPRSLPSLLLFLLLATLPAAAQQSVDAPRAGERETAQAGGEQARTCPTPRRSTTSTAA